MDWARIPTAWIIREEKLSLLTWRQEKSSATAALILLIALAIRLNQSNDGRMVDRDRQRTSFRESYNELQSFTGLSRAKISAGLRLLNQMKIVTISRVKRMNQYTLRDIVEDGKWAKVPQTHLLNGKTLLFSKFQLRHRHELNALKLYLLLIAYRDRRTNFAVIGYDKICKISGVMRNDISSALSLLMHLDLVRVKQDDPVNGNSGRPHNCYRIRGLGFEL
jgi:DNA-binding transcriptional ArsR family regulator